MTKDKRFDSILDNCLERLLSGEESVEQCLDRYPEYSAELEPLLRTALVTQQVASIEPSRDFRARARYRLRSEMTTVRKSSWRSFLTWQPRWAVVVAAVLAVLIAGSGTVMAADSSMPGNPLYPVKLATENVRLSLTSSDVAKAELYATLANRRVAEIAHAVEKNKAKHVQRVTERLNEHLARMARLSLTAERAPAAVPEKTAGQEPSVSDEPSTEKDLPESTTAAERPAATSDAARSAAPAPEAIAWQKERARLQVLLGHYAVNHPEKLRELLTKAPPSARPAILRAISVSVATYRKALEELGQQETEPPPNNDRPQSRGQGENSPANGTAPQTWPHSIPAPEGGLRQQPAESPTGQQAPRLQPFSSAKPDLTLP